MKILSVFDKSVSEDLKMKWGVRCLKKESKKNDSKYSILKLALGLSKTKIVCHFINHRLSLHEAVENTWNPKFLCDAYHVYTAGY